MELSHSLQIIFGAAAIFICWAAANQVASFGSRWIRWRSLVQASHAGRGAQQKLRMTENKDRARDASLEGKMVMGMEVDPAVRSIARPIARPLNQLIAREEIACLRGDRAARP